MSKIDNNKKNELLLKKLIYTNLTNTNIDLNLYNIDINEFKKYFLNNIKKSSKNGQILPSFLFLTISLVSFSVVIFSPKFVKFWGELDNDNLLIAIMLYGVLFLIFSVILLVQKYIFKIKTVSFYNGYSKGFKNITNKKYIEILDYLNNEIGK